MLQSGAWIRVCAEFGFGIFYSVAAVGTSQRTDFGRPQAGIRFSVATPIHGNSIPPLGCGDRVRT